jgi:hypothetical protein
MPSTTSKRMHQLKSGLQGVDFVMLRSPKQLESHQGAMHSCKLSSSGAHIFPEWIASSPMPCEIVRRYARIINVSARIINVSEVQCSSL